MEMHEVVVAMSVEEIAIACNATPEAIVELARAGLFAARPGEPRQWRFASADLARARRALALQRDLDANLELAALVCDLVDEVERLRSRLRRAGIAPG